MDILRILSKTNDLNSCMHVQCNRKKNINMTMSLAVVSIFPHFFALLSLKLYNIPLIQLRNLRFAFFYGAIHVAFEFFKVHFSDFFLSFILSY